MSKSISDVIRIPPGTKENPSWIEGPVVGLCRKVDLRTYGEGKKMWPCIIADESTGETVEATFFTAPKFQEGDRVEFGGKGLRRGEYNGKAKLEIGKDTTISVSAGAPKVEAAVHGSQAQHANEGLVSGQTVGMAMKLAVETMTRDLKHDEITRLVGTPGFWKGVHETASDVIRVARLLESGSLADPVKVRKGALQGGTQRVDGGYATKPSHNPEQELTEDVPF